MAVPCRVVLGMEGDRPGVYGPLACPTQHRYVGKNQDTGPVLPSLDGDMRSMERGVVSWCVRHRHGRHAIPSARWPVGTPVSSLRGPRFTIQASAVARLTISMHQTLRSVGEDSKLDPRDHRIPDSASPARKAKHTTAAVTFAADVGIIPSTPGRSSPIEELASSDLLQPSRGFSIPLPHCDMFDTEPAVAPVTMPTYVLFSIDGEVLLSTSPVSLVLVPRALLLSARRGRSVSRRWLPMRYLRISPRRVRRFRCSPRDRCCRVGFSQSLMKPVRSAAPRRLLLPYLPLVRPRSSRPWP